MDGDGKGVRLCFLSRFRRLSGKLFWIAYHWPMTAGKDLRVDYLTMQGITKRYPERNVLANDAVDLAVRHGEIHAIVGENGAGKTTLMRILYGLEKADAGTVRIDGAPVEIHSPADADRLGIGMVHQHFRLIPEFTLAENITLGAEPRKHRLFLDRRAAARQIGEVLARYRLDPGLDLDRRVSQLTVGQMQQVEIIRLLYRNSNLLILDEPTAVLTDQQVLELFETLRYLAGQGKTIIIITHKLDEVKAVSQRVTVMRQGRIAAVCETAAVDKRELARLMVGRSVLFHLERKAVQPGSAVLELRQVWADPADGRREALRGVDLTVRQGEILGAVGIAGNGLGVLEDLVGGLVRADRGTVLHHGEDVTRSDVFALRRRGLAYVPSDRMQRGSSRNSSVLDNLIVSTHHAFLSAGVFRRGEATAYGSRLMEQFSIAGSLEMPAGELSGGNLQKVILAREFSLLQDLILFSEPTWGLDIASSEYVYEHMLACRDRGIGVLLISSNLDEVLGLADRIAVFYRGRITGLFDNGGKASRALVGECMLGLHDEAGEEAEHAR